MQLIFFLIGGLGLFFYGMQTMSDGLKKIAGTRLKNILHMMTRVPLIAVLVGAAVTCFIQSSSATSIMVIGFVNAGLVSLRQAISVIMGANIGTTFTAWLVSSMSVFKITHYALPAIGIGFFTLTFARRKSVRFWGQVLMGFGMLFLGLSMMKDAFEPLRDSPHLQELFVSFARNPLLGVLVGTVATMLLQSSSATIAIVQVLAFNGLISFPAAIPLILGDNIGTTITAQIAAAGANTNARRVAMSHTLFNVIGTAYMLGFVYSGWFVKAVDMLIPGSITLKNVMFYIAVAHSVFNVTNTLVFLPFLGFIEKATVILVPKKKGAVELKPQFLERHLLNTPAIALEQAVKEMVRMLGLATTSVSTAVKSFLERQSGLFKQIPELEEAVDSLQSEITCYLVELSQNNLSPEYSESLPVLLHSVNDIERIGDHSENIVELAERAIDEKLQFSDEALQEATLMWNELHSMCIETRIALKKNDIRAAQSVLSREKKINLLQKELKKAHVDRLGKACCDLRAGVVFIDFIDNLEKIGDHLTNIAEGVIGKMRWKLHKHDLS